MKTCNSCKKSKPLSEFHKQTASKDGHQGKCKPCNNSSAREWQAENYESFLAKAKAYSKEDQTKLVKRARRYGIEVDKLLELMLEHGTTCPVCKRDSGGKILSVDHCHKSLKVRGLLCTKCNFVLGLVDDSPEILRELAKYLKKNDRGL